MKSNSIVLKWYTWINIIYFWGWRLFIKVSPLLKIFSWQQIKLIITYQNQNKQINYNLQKHFNLVSVSFRNNNN